MIEDVRKSELLAELTNVLSDGVSQDLWLLSVGIDNNPWGQYQPLILDIYIFSDTDLQWKIHNSPNVLRYLKNYLLDMLQNFKFFK